MGLFAPQFMGVPPFFDFSNPFLNPALAAHFAASGILPHPAMQLAAAMYGLDSEQILQGPTLAPPVAALEAPVLPPPSAAPEDFSLSAAQALLALPPNELAMLLVKLTGGEAAAPDEAPPAEGSQ